MKFFKMINNINIELFVFNEWKNGKWKKKTENRYF